MLQHRKTHADIAQHKTTNLVKHDCAPPGQSVANIVNSKDSLSFPNNLHPGKIFASTNATALIGTGTFPLPVPEREGFQVPQIPWNFLENLQSQQNPYNSDRIPLEHSSLELFGDGNMPANKAGLSSKPMPNGLQPISAHGQLIAGIPTLLGPSKTTILRDPKKAPRGCPKGHWWCKLCIKYLKLDKFNPSTKAMQYKYLCSLCETKTKQDQAGRFKRGSDGNVNPNHPRRVGAKNKIFNAKRDDTLPESDGRCPDVRPNPKKRRRRGRRWSSVEKVLNGFDPKVDWRLVVLGIRNHNVHCSANFQAGKDFASRELLNRFRNWASMLPEQQGPLTSLTAAAAGVAMNGTSSKPQISGAPITSDSFPCTQSDTLLRQIHSLNIQQRLISQQLEECVETFVQLQRNVKYHTLDGNSSTASLFPKSHTAQPILPSSLLVPLDTIADPPVFEEPKKLLVPKPELSC